MATNGDSQAFSRSKPKPDSGRRFGFSFRFNVNQSGKEPNWSDWCIVIGAVGAMATVIISAIKSLWEVISK